jgi:flavin reductase (DIM6/NTAB) family NADH-FMN oxidoreductase RutF
MALDGRAFRQLMGNWATGVTVVTMPTATGLWGMTANSFTSVSLDPTLVLVSVDRATRTLGHMERSGIWAVNILAEDQEQLSRVFAMKEDTEERTLARVPYHMSEGGVPIIDGCLASLECKTWATYDGGDHVLFLGEIQRVEADASRERPLLFYRGKYHHLPES